jgi:hypothetical protein
VSSDQAIKESLVVARDDPSASRNRIRCADDSHKRRDHVVSQMLNEHHELPIRRLFAFRRYLPTDHMNSDAYLSAF